MFPQQLDDMYKKPRSAFALKKPASKSALSGKGKGDFTVNVDGVSHKVTIEEIA